MEPGRNWPRCACGEPCTPNFEGEVWLCGNSGCRGHEQICGVMTSDELLALVHALETPRG